MVSETSAEGIVGRHMWPGPWTCPVRAVGYRLVGKKHMLSYTFLGFFLCFFVRGQLCGSIFRVNFWWYFYLCESVAVVVVLVFCYVVVGGTTALCKLGFTLFRDKFVWGV